MTAGVGLLLATRRPLGTLAPRAAHVRRRRHRLGPRSYLPPDTSCTHCGGACEQPALVGRWVCPRYARRLERPGRAHRPGTTASWSAPSDERAADDQLSVVTRTHGLLLVPRHPIPAQSRLKTSTRSSSQPINAMSDDKERGGWDTRVSSARSRDQSTVTGGSRFAPARL
jgi:hypothetical protein